MKVVTEFYEFNPEFDDTIDSAPTESVLISDLEILSDQSEISQLIIMNSQLN